MMYDSVGFVNGNLELFVVYENVLQASVKD